VDNEIMHDRWKYFAGDQEDPGKSGKVAIADDSMEL